MSPGVGVGGKSPSCLRPATIQGWEPTRPTPEGDAVYFTNPGTTPKGQVGLPSGTKSLSKDRKGPRFPDPHSTLLVRMGTHDY